MSLNGAFEALIGNVAGEVRRAEPMSRHTSWRIGGPAGLFVVAETLADLHRTTRVFLDHEVPFTVVGKGTNLLVSDSGYDGAVLVLGREFRRHVVDAEQGRIRAGGGAMLAALVQDGFKSGLGGLAFAVGIPGTFGGALAMNAGANKGGVGDAAESVTLFVPGDGLRRLRGAEIPWGYRTSGLDRIGIIVEAELRAEPGDPQLIRAEMERYFKARKESQPLSVPNAGSVFRNPDGDSAGRLIEASGLKDARVGGAVVSDKHANFIVNDSDASAADVVALMKHVAEAVSRDHGVELRPEIRFLGSFGQA
jgi:UDP-N-acetylmuramate dehydrogenase